MATAKKPAPKQSAPAKKAAAPAKKAAPAPAKKAAPAQKAAPAPAKKAAAAQKAAPAPAKKAAPAPAKKAAPAPAKKAAAAKKAAPAPAKKVAPAPAKKAAPAPAKKAAAVTPSVPTPPPAPAPAPVKKAAPPAKKAPAKSTEPSTVALPPVRGVTKDGVAYTKDFDAKFLTMMRARLLEERVELTGQANRLEDEANALIAEAEMGDVQFDDEGGEGDTMVVERERDLALSAQARQTVADIDTALVRLQQGTYGYSIISGKPIPRERLDAIPWADVLVQEKAGGLGRR
jgi:RNA polymerase-binding transcription factor DksA